MRLVILLLLPIFLYASNIDMQLSYYESQNPIALQKIEQKKFTPLQNSYFERGFTHNYIWIKIKLSNLSNKNIKKILYLDNPVLNSVKLYDKLEQSYIKKRDALYYTFNITLPPQNTKEYYLMLHSKNTLSTKINIVETSSYKNSIENKKNFLIFFFGFVLSIIIYNTFLFVILKEKTYLYYITFQFITLTLFTAFSGLGLYLFWENNHLLNNFIIKIFDDLSILFALLFIAQFLNIKENSKILYNSIFIAIILLIYCILAPSPNIFVKLIMIGSIFLVLSTSIYGVYKKISGAKLFFFGWFILILSSIITLMKNFGHLESNFFTTWSLYLGSMIEAIVFSIALASKIETLKKEKENILLNMKQTLQKQIKRKTKKLNSSLKQREILLKELNHRTKNNLQIISSFINILNLKESDKKIKSNYQALTDRINAISLVHQLFSKQKHLEKINTKKYFNSIIQNLSHLISKNKTIDFDIEICKKQLNTDQITTLGLILNELITNSFKYAFDGKNTGLITIKFQFKNGIYTFIYKDDGIGFNYEKQSGKSLGLQLIKRLSTKQLNSSFEFISDMGSCFIFQFKEVQNG